MTAILRLPDVKARTGLSRSTIYAYAKQGIFPKPILIGVRAVGWASQDIDDWVSQRTGNMTQKGE
jgi:prophage regulatory protein